MASAVKRVRKRDGRLVDFDQGKITNAIYKALFAIEGKDGDTARTVSDRVVEKLSKLYAGKTPGVEAIQDLVVETLRETGHDHVALDYQSYRERKAGLRALRGELGILDEPKLTVNAIEVLEKRYLLKDEKGELIETPTGMFWRVAEAVAFADEKYGGDSKAAAKEFYGVMSRLEFIPNSPTLFNAGTKTGFALSACYVLPVEDSLEGIFTSLKNMALIEQTGGGVGFDFSRLRPAGDVVKTTMGVASGPVSFMKIFDAATEVIKAGGRRRGAMMAILRVDHPDVIEFITAKTRPGVLTNFNISVTVTDAFMDAVDRNSDYDLINPRTKQPVRKLSARYVWDRLVDNAWRSGDPGIVFIDEVNRYNPTPIVGDIESTNPCGEQPLLPYESCNLGSINLSKMFREGTVGWDKLRRTTYTAVHFLDNVIDVNPYPLKETDKITRANRKIGLGVMGFADLLILMGVPYDSEKATEIGEEIARFINEEAGKASERLGLERGSFPNFEASIWKGKFRARRNATVTTIAPTGTISIIAGCSSGIEPLFAVAFMRHVLEGARLFELHPIFEEIAKKRGFYGGETLEKIVSHGTIRDVQGVPEDLRRVFVTAHDITPDWHVKIQAAFQKHTENAVSKTVNLPEDASLNDVENVFHLAYALRCKGVTVYRYGSKGAQVLNLGVESRGEEKVATAEAEYAGGRPIEGCEVCG
ncbi:MAG: adenosylcobalamin-dependent ribonucleoside-diphosphate reductase [Candidatus Bathyarchaeota archaeon]|nr:adenosylcobalamin-dependent ribonucleoside-diphosphate reductase [Candidatus Bathyarchaeota archaeon]